MSPDKIQWYFYSEGSFDLIVIYPIVIFLDVINMPMLSFKGLLSDIKNVSKYYFDFETKLDFLGVFSISSTKGIKQKYTENDQMYC